MKRMVFSVVLLGACTGLLLSCSDDDDKDKADGGAGGEAGLVTEAGNPSEAGAQDDSGSGDDQGGNQGIGDNICLTVTPLCEEDSECPAETPVCVDGQCQMCREDADCPTEQFHGGCNQEFHFCLMCGDDSHCTVAGQPLMTGICDTFTGACTGCETDTDCDVFQGQLPFCNNGVCAQCKSDADCAAADLKGCYEEAGICGLCTSDAECCPAGQPDCGLTCNTDSGNCQCTSDQQCADVYATAGVDQDWECVEIE